MSTSDRWYLSREKQQALIDALTPELASLRARAGISQGELAYMIGVSRQTYSAIELCKKTMSWNTYISLIWFFDSNASTRVALHMMGAYPDGLVNQFNEGRPLPDIGKPAAQESPFSAMYNSLDAIGMHAVESMLRIEYERCSKQD